MKQVSTISKLEEMSKHIGWMPIDITKGGTHIKMGEFDLAFAITRNSSKDSTMNRISFRFANGLMKQMGWNPGDYISILTHPEDELTLLLVKGTIDSGYLLSLENNKINSVKIQFIWKGKSILKNRPLEVISDKLITVDSNKQKNLIFRVNT